MLNLLIFNLKTDADDEVLGFTTDWINEIAKHCASVFVITMTSGRLAVADNVVVMSVGREKGYSEFRRALRFYSLLAGLLRSHRIDACFAHMMPLFAVMAWPLLARRHIPIVLWYAHGSTSVLLRLATLLVDRIVTSSRSGFKIPTRKLRIIGQGIDTGRFRAQHQPSPGPFTVVTIGRISPIKNIHLLVEAVALLRHSHPGTDVQARIVGSPITDTDRGYADELRTQINRLGLSDSVVLVPGRPFVEIHKLYLDADCFVNSSDTDSVDKTVLEAMSCGVPIVTSNPSFYDVLGPKLAARWVVPKQDVRALHARIAELMDMQPIMRKALGYELRRIVVCSHSLPALSGRIIAQIKEVNDE